MYGEWIHIAEVRTLGVRVPAGKERKGAREEGGMNETFCFGSEGSLYGK